MAKVIMEFTLEKITAFAQSVFTTQTPFPERIQKTVGTFLEQSKETDTIFLQFELANQLWHSDSKIQKGGKIVRLSKVHQVASQKPTYTIRVETRQPGTEDSRLAPFEKDLLEAIASKSGKKKNRVQMLLQSDSNAFSEISSFPELVKFLGEKGFEEQADSSDRAIAKRIVEEKVILEKFALGNDFAHDDCRKVFEVSRSIFGRESQWDAKNKLATCYFGILAHHFDLLVSKKITRIQRVSFSSIQGNIQILKETRKIVGNFLQNLKFAFDALEEGEKICLFENLEEFLDKNIQVEETIGYLKDQAKASEYLTRNLATFYANTAVFEVLDFENRINVFFDLEANFNLMDLILKSNGFIQGDLLANKSLYAVTCYFLTVVSSFANHRQIFIESVDKQSKTIKEKVDQIFDGNLLKSRKTFETVRESLSCIRQLEFLFLLHTQMQIDDGFIHDGISNLKKLIEKMVRSWIQNMRKLSSEINLLVNSKHSFDLNAAEAPFDFSKLRLFMELQKEHLYLKELVSDPLLDNSEVSTDLIIDEDTAVLFLRSRHFFQNISRWRNLVSYYNSLEKNFDKRQLSFVLKELSDLEVCLKSVTIANFEEKLSQGEIFMKLIEANLKRVNEFEGKAKVILLKAAEEVNRNFGFISSVKSLISEFQKSFDQQTSKGICLFVQNQMLKVVFLRCQLLLRNKRVFQSNEQSLKVQLKKSPHQKDLETFPSIPAIRKQFYAQIQELLLLIKDSASGMSNDYLEVLIESRLKTDLENAYCFIEDLLQGLTQHIKSEIGSDLISGLNFDQAPSSNSELEKMQFGELYELYGSAINKLNFLQGRLKELEGMPEFMGFRGLIRLQTRMAKTALIEETQSNFQNLIASLQVISTQCVFRCETFVKKFNESIGKKIETIEQFQTVNNFMQTIKTEKDRIQKFYQLLKDSNGILRKSEGESMLVQRISNFLKGWEKLQGLQLSSNIEIEKLKDELLKLLDSQSRDLTDKLDAFTSTKSEVASSLQSFCSPDLEYSDMKLKAEYLAEKIQMWNDLSTRIAELKKNSESLGHKDQNIDMLYSQSAQVSSMFEGADFAYTQKMLTFVNKLSEFGKEPWIDFSRQNWKRLTTFLDDEVQAAVLDNSKNSFNQNYQKTVSRYQVFAKTHISLIIGEQYSNNDWLELLDILSYKRISLEDFTLEHLLSAEARIRGSLPRIRDLNLRINEESNIRKMLEEVIAWKGSAELKFVSYPFIERYVFSVVTDWDSLLDQLSDYSFQVRVMSESRFKLKFKEQLESLKEFTENTELLYRELQIVQQRLVYLDPILLKARLEDKSTIEKFYQMKSRLAEFYKYLKDSKYVNSITAFSHTGVLLKDAEKLFENIQKVLASYLSEKRSVFPRLHLLSDEDLVELIGNCENEESLQQHIPKIFSSVGKVVLNADLRIQEILSSPCNGAIESITLISKISVKDQEVEQWLLSFQSGLMQLLKKQLKEYSYEHVDRLDFILNFELNATRPSQILFLAQEVIYESLFKGAFRSHTFPALLEAYLTFIRELCVQSKSKESTGVEIEKQKQVIMHSVRKVNAIRDCINNSTNRRWNLFKTMIYQAYTPPQMPLEVSIQMADSNLSYSWEYQGLKTPLVYTGVTDKVFVGLARCLLDRQGANLTGPAGTGKTESIKFFAQHLARNIIVFNCDEELKFDIIGSIFKGFVSEEAFGCFDEFNRLNPSQMSVVSQLIQSLQNALRRANASKSNVPLDDFVGFPSINPGCAVFITMNPKTTEYGARYALPQNLKNLFRVVNVSTPSEKQVFEVLLMAEGCEDYSGLSQKLSSFFEIARNKFSKQSHYDWSLRKVKSVISSFKAFRQNEIFGDDHADLYSLLKAIETNIVSYLLPADLYKFEEVITEVFKEAYNDYKAAQHTKKPSKFSAMSEKSDKELRLLTIRFSGSHGGWMSEKLTILENLLQARDGVILYGSPMSGKSLLWKMLLSQEQGTEKSSVFHILNPKTGNKRLLLGKSNSDTGEFNDGYLTSLLRSIQKTRELESSHQRKRIYLIFDAEIDSEWIEALNSVLDDNKMLSLPNGERITVPPIVKFIFETRSLKFASPATLSRLGIISMESEMRLNTLISVDPKYNYHGGKVINVRIEDFFISANAVLPSDNTSKNYQHGTHSKAQLDEGEHSVPKGQFQNKTSGTVQFGENRKVLEALSFATKLLKMDSEQINVKQEEKNKLQMMPSEGMQPMINPSRQSIDTTSMKESVSTKLLLNFEDFVTNNISKNLIQNFSKVLLSNSNFILNNFPIYNFSFTNEVFSLAAGSLFRSMAGDPYIRTVNSTNDFNIEGSRYAESSLAAGQLSQISKTLLSKGISLFVYSKRQVVDINELSRWTGIDSNSMEGLLVIPCTAKMKTLDILRLVKNFYQVVSKSGKKYLENCSGSIEKNSIIFTNFEAIDCDSYHSTQVYEALYTIINYRFIIDPETFDRLEFSDSTRFVFVSHLKHSELFDSVPLKILRKCFTIYNDDDEETAGNQGNQNKGEEAGEILIDLAGSAISDDLAEYISKTFHELKTRLQDKSGKSILADNFERAILQELSLFSLNDKNEAKAVLWWLIKAILVTQIDSSAKAMVCEEQLLELLKGRDQNSDYLLKSDAKSDLYSAPSFKFVRAAEFKLFFNDLKASYNEQVQMLDLKEVSGQQELLQLLILVAGFRVRQNKLNALVLTGGRGRGRKTTLNLFALSQGFQIQSFQQQPNGKSLKEFRKLLLTVLGEIFMSDKKVILTVEEYQLTSQRLIDELILFTKCGVIKGLEQEDRDNLVRLDPLFGQNSDKTRNLGERFASKLAKNLCIVVILDNPRQNGKSFTDRYPAAQSIFHFINCDHVLRYGFALPQLEYQIEQILPLEEGDDLKKRLADNGFISHVEEHLPLSSFPIYTNFCKNIAHIYSIKTQELNEKSVFLEQGIKKLGQAEHQVLELQNLAHEKSKLVQSKTVENEYSLKKISEIYTKTKHKFETLKKAEDQLKERELEIVCKKEEVISQLSQIMPILEAARNQVKSISKGHLDELRSLKNPPAHVVNVFTALLKLKGKEKTNFEEARKVLGTSSEIEELANFDFKKVDSKILKNVKEFIEKESSSFDKKTIYHVSQAAGPIAEFVVAIVKCREFYSTIEPYEKTLESLERSLEFSKKETDVLKADVAQIDDEVRQLKNTYAIKLGETEIFKKELENINKRLSTSHKLLASLPDEKIRWAQKLSDMAKTKKQLIGLCFASSWKINFILTKKLSSSFKNTTDESNNPVNSQGKKNDQSRNSHMAFEERILMSVFEIFGIENFDLLTFLGDEKFIVETVNNDLPQNSRALNNVTSSIWSSGFPLIIDPSDKITQFLKVRAGKGSISVNLHDKSLFQKLLASLKSGSTLFIENFSSNFPPYLFPIIRRDFFDRSTTSREIILCGKNVSVSCLFRVIITTRFSESVNCTSLDYLTLVDNSYGKETLTSYYISLVLEKFDSNLQKERNGCLEKQFELKERLLETERSLLESIGQMKGNLLDDDKLVKQLESIKAESSSIVEKITESQKLIEQIKFKENKYMPLASFLADTFISLSNLKRLNSFYNFSIDFYNFNVQACLSSFEDPSVDLSKFSSAFTCQISKKYGSALLKEDLGLLLLILVRADKKIPIDDMTWKIMQEDLSNIENNEESQVNSSNKSGSAKGARHSSKRISISLFKDKSSNVYDPSQDEDPDNKSERIDEGKLLEAIANLKSDAVELLAEKMPELLNELRRNFESWMKWLETEKCENSFPSKSNGVVLPFGQKLLLTYLLRKDRVTSLMLKAFQEYYGPSESDFAFNPIHLSNAWTILKGPIIIQIKEGLDPSSDISLMLKHMSPAQQVEDVSCGDGNSALVLDKINGSRDKTIVLKNFHLCPKIYDEVAALVSAQESKKNLRLIFVSEDASSLPLELIDNSLKINYEKEQDFHQNMVKHYSLLGEGRFAEVGPEKSNYLFCLVYLHVSLSEFEKQDNIFRKKYELNWNDFERAVNFLIGTKEDEIENFALIFVNMLQFSLYGSKIDDPVDFEALQRYLKSLFSFGNQSREIVLELPTRFSFEEHKEKAKRARTPRTSDLGIQPSKQALAANSGTSKAFASKLRSLLLS
jgi:MoxR-like ATPase